MVVMMMVTVVVMMMVTVMVMMTGLTRSSTPGEGGSYPLASQRLRGRLVAQGSGD